MLFRNNLRQSTTQRSQILPRMKSRRSLKSHASGSRSRLVYHQKVKSYPREKFVRLRKHHSLKTLRNRILSPPVALSPPGAPSNTTQFLINIHSNHPEWLSLGQLNDSEFEIDPYGTMINTPMQQGSSGFL
eukprot:TRINITY_DN2854_c0_g1_i4.p1 TRINITY_DN2854_c0_g1~~TRINITY_DN2854_c0_g1_i4.p1  ORF type:complete len:148 (-),score=21.36 TRINITY_DN2854_c0_g1_i4:206-598(-)